MHGYYAGKDIASCGNIRNGFLKMRGDSVKDFTVKALYENFYLFKMQELKVKSLTFPEKENF
jgi:hypothetical protein